MWDYRLFFLVMVLVGLASHEHSQATALSVGRKTALVTGSTDGIGLTTAKNLAAKGIHVLIHGRDQDRIQAAVRKVEQFKKMTSDSKSLVIPLPPRDVSTVKECELLTQDVRQICDKESLKLQILMNNAGVYSEDLVFTKDDLELTFAVNVLAPFVVTSLLLDKLLEEKSRIVIASSISQCGSIKDWKDVAFYEKRKYSAHTSYSESKLLDAMLNMEIAHRLMKSGHGPDSITCNCLDPGTVNTKMLLAGWGSIGINVETALDETWLCTSDEVDGVTGKYFTYQSPRRDLDSYAANEREKLWNLLSNLAPNAAKCWETL